MISHHINYEFRQIHANVHVYMFIHIHFFMIYDTMNKFQLTFTQERFNSKPHGKIFYKRR